jgi:hypothetical protein
MPCRTDLDSGLSPEQDSKFIAFTQICAEKGILGRPDGLEEDDCTHGLSDPVTLLYALPWSMSVVRVSDLISTGDF